MISKKYFSISEASKICSLAPHKLRYIDKTDKNISITKIRGRRYYTIQNIEYIVKNYSDITNSISINPPIQNNLSQKEVTNLKPTSEANIASEDNIALLARIDNLLQNFHTLKKDLVLI